MCVNTGVENSAFDESRQRLRVETAAAILSARATLPQRCSKVTPPSHRAAGAGTNPDCSGLAFVRGPVPPGETPSRQQDEMWLDEADDAESHSAPCRRTPPPRPDERGERKVDPDLDLAKAVGLEERVERQRERRQDQRLEGAIGEAADRRSARRRLPTDDAECGAEPRERGNLCVRSRERRKACQLSLVHRRRLAGRRDSRYGGQPSQAIMSEGWWT